MKIAIVKLSALGDIVHAMVVLQYIKKNNLEIEIDWIVEEKYKELLEANPDIRNVEIVNIKKAQQKKSFSLFYKELRRIQKFGPYDLVIDMQGLIKSSIIARLVPSKSTLGFDRFSVREGFASFFYNKTFNYAYNKNIIERNFELIKFALDLPYKFEEIQNKIPFLYANNNFEIPALSTNKNNIILIPGSSHSSKCYPVESFAELTYLLDANYIIIWGSKEEKSLAISIQNIAPSVTICEKLSILGLVDLISKSDLVIGPDSGPTHFSWALNVPSITLFGSTPGYRNTFLTSNNKIIESKSDVNPTSIDKKDYSIAEIKPIEISDLAKNILDHAI